MTVASSEYLNAPLPQLRVGAQLHCPIYDARSSRRPLLLAAGATLSETQLRALQQRGVTEVLVHASEFDRVVVDGQALAARSEPVPQPAADKRARSLVPGWRNDPDSFLHSVRRPETLARDPQRAAEYERTYAQAVETTRSIVDRLVAHRELKTCLIQDVSQRNLNEIADDLDEFLFRGLRPVCSDYPSRHSLQTAMLAASMGTTMGLRADELMELAFGCLLHDVGMLLVPQEILNVAGPMTPTQRLEIQKHPIYSADLIQNCRDVPPGARHVVYQMHERMNGSGYPRQRTGPQIHPLARIAAIADMYLALVSPRPFRPPLEPYRAIEKLLFSTRQGLFDASAVRALIHTVSVFPIGSGVQLSDGRTARVIRGNRDQFARPVVQIVEPGQSADTGEVVDLCASTELTVVATAQLPDDAATPAKLAVSV
uniref:HD-GYP domain-containing protein n=1 Tax=Schlesneria paludicola TaxID=360056 RepID=A0A7C2K2M9_9PLAN